MSNKETFSGTKALELMYQDENTVCFFNGGWYKFQAGELVTKRAPLTASSDTGVWKNSTLNIKHFINNELWYKVENRR
jgi:hypothetical protein